MFRIAARPTILIIGLAALASAQTGKCLKQASRPRPPRNHRWATFVQNHGSEIIACDFFTTVTATFPLAYTSHGRGFQIANDAFVMRLFRGQAICEAMCQASSKALGRGPATAEL